MAKIAPCLWFDANAEEAANFYAATFRDSHDDAVNRAPGDHPSGKAGELLTADFTVCGMTFLGLNGRPAFGFTNALSFQIYTENQAETDRYWNAIVDNGGTESMCGWCKDRSGLSWQIAPRRLIEAMTSKDAAASTRAMMTMRRINIAARETAFAGETA